MRSFVVTTTIALGLTFSNAAFVNAADIVTCGYSIEPVGAALAAETKLVDVKYSKKQKKEIRAAYAKFPSYEAPYAPRKMAAGDRYQRTVAGEDGVAMMFDHMRVIVSPRDYADPSQGTTVTLPNGVTARWYAAGQAAGAEERLAFPVDDRFVTISSPDRTLSRMQMEGIAATVAKL